jgi:F-type H+-transporting ATPase subunit gamma
MSSTKEIRSKIQSIKSTQKITRAMEMVAASKMRKAQERMYAARPYAARIRNVIGHVAQGRLEYQHAYLLERPVKRVGILVVSTDRGLCGGLNTNLFKSVVPAMKAWDDQNIPVELAVVGNKAETFFNRLGGRVIACVSSLKENTGMPEMTGVIKVLLDAYADQHLDRIYIAYNDFVNTMVQKPRIELLLPIIDTTPPESRAYWDYLYEPDAKMLLDKLLVRYTESLVFQGLLENNACEQAARMVAMKNASENASDMIKDLQLAYNRLRQASITRELAEIVAGASAV